MKFSRLFLVMIAAALSMHFAHAQQDPLSKVMVAADDGTTNISTVSLVMCSASLPVGTVCWTGKSISRTARNGVPKPLSSYELRTYMSSLGTKKVTLHANCEASVKPMGEVVHQFNGCTASGANEVEAYRQLEARLNSNASAMHARNGSVKDPCDRCTLNQVYYQDHGQWIAFSKEKLTETQEKVTAVNASEMDASTKAAKDTTAPAPKEQGGGAYAPKANDGAPDFHPHH